MGTLYPSIFGLWVQRHPRHPVSRRLWYDKTDERCILDPCSSCSVVSRPQATRMTHSLLLWFRRRVFCCHPCCLIHFSNPVKSIYIGRLCLYSIWRLYVSAHSARFATYRYDWRLAENNVCSVLTINMKSLASATFRPRWLADIGPFTAVTDLLQAYS